MSGAEYWSALSQDSRRSLELQGGVFSRAEADAFISRPHAAAGVRVRVWDDLAKQAGASTPPLRHYLELAERIAARG